jgi:hypothetical protein
VNVELSSAEVQRRVSARAVPDTVLLEASVVDSDPHRSERIANELATRFIALVQSLETPPGSDTPAVKVDVVAGPLLNPTSGVTAADAQPRPRARAGPLDRRRRGPAARRARRHHQDGRGAGRGDRRSGVGGRAVRLGGQEVAARDGRRSPLVAGRGLPPPRTNLQFVDVDRPVKVVVVTSSVPEEGKTTTTVNLAIAFARAGRKVLLIEADLRRPKVGDYLGLEARSGCPMCSPAWPAATTCSSGGARNTCTFSPAA